MVDYLARAGEMLFPTNGPTALNVKFLCGGTADGATVQDLAEQIVRAEVQVRSGGSQPLQSVDRHLTD